MTSLDIPLKANSDKRIMFSESSVTYRDKSIAYSDVASIRFGTSKAITNFSVTVGFFVFIRSIDGRKIDIRCQTIKFSLRGSEPTTNFGAIISAVRRYVAPALLTRILETIATPGHQIKIASMVFDSTGITSENLFGGRKRAPWSAKPEVRSTLGNNYLTGASLTGIIEVSYFNAMTSKMVVIGKASSTDDNGFLVPHICRIISDSI